MATLFTRIINDTGSGVSGAKILLRRRWTPQARVGAVTNGQDVTLTADVNGFITSPIIGGVFRVWIHLLREPRLITVPDDDGTYLLEDLMGVTGGTAALTYRYVGTSLQILSGTSGEFRTFRIRGSPLQFAVDQTNDMSPNFQWIDGCLQILNADTNAWHAVYITGSGTGLQIAIGAAGSTTGPNARVQGGKLQLRNLTTDLYHTIYLSGEPPTWVIAAGES